MTDSEPQPEPAMRSPAQWRRSVQWFAAEFLVVVTGVLVALLMNAWWTGREAAERERHALERLYEESESITRYLKAHLARNDSMLRQKDESVAALFTNAPEIDLEHFRQGIFFAFTYPAASPPRTVYDEVTQSGAFGQIRSVEARTAISEYYGELARFHAQLQFFRQTAQPGIELTMTYPYEYDATGRERMRVLVDPEMLRGDGAARSLLVVGLRNQIAFQTLRQSLYDDAVAMCRTLAAQLARTCEAAE